MNEITRRDIALVDLSRQLKREQCGVLLATGDSYANVFGAALTRNGANVDLSGCTVRGEFIRADGVTVMMDGTTNGNTALVQLIDNCYAISGNFTLAVKVTGGGVTHTVRVVDGYIRTTSTDRLVDPDEKIVSLPELLEMCDELEQTTAEAKTALSEINDVMTGVDEAVADAEKAVADAEQAVTDANNAVSAVEGMTVSATSGTAASAKISDVDGVKHIDFVLPKGDKGETGDTGPEGPQGKTPVKGVDYYTDTDKAEFSEYIASELAKRGQLRPEFANSVEECTDTSLLYVLPDGYIYAYLRREETVEGGKIPNFTNVLDNAQIELNKRYNSSNILKDADGYIAVDLTGISSGNVVRFKPASLAQGVSGGNQRFRLYNASGTLLSNGDTATGDEYTLHVDDDVASLTIPTYGSAVSYARANLYVSSGAITEDDTKDLIITVNEEITYTTTEGGTSVTYEWSNTGHAFVPADYEPRIIEAEEGIAALDSRVKVLENTSNASALSIAAYAPSPQLPADGSDAADFDAETCTAEDIYAYLDALAAKYPRYITKEVLGKDASGAHDWCRYTCCRRYYDAWVKPAYPAMYAWVNGSTVIYSVSVSPRVGDTMYSTAYIGTAYSTVTAVDNANQTRTVNGLVFSRKTDSYAPDVQPTLVYTLTKYSANRPTKHNAVYGATKNSIGTIASIADGVLTDSNGATYNRYPMGDTDSKFVKPDVIVIGSNEHGREGDPAEPAIISARLAKDLCECVNMDNLFLNLLKNDYMVVFCPVINPWGLARTTGGYVNSNGVNIDRNFDCPGWGNDTDTRHGDYGGSENETQYYMNTVVESGAKIALANHGLGTHTDSTGEAANAGTCCWMMGKADSKYDAPLIEIQEAMSANYNLELYNMGLATPDVYGKTRSYIAMVGADGGAVEMQAREGYLLDGDGDLHTARILEADYTLLLQFLHMLIECQE